jgi:hypothetical protein
MLHIPFGYLVSFLTIFSPAAHHVNLLAPTHVTAI